MERFNINDINILNPKVEEYIMLGSEGTLIHTPNLFKEWNVCFVPSVPFPDCVILNFIWNITVPKACTCLIHIQNNVQLLGRTLIFVKRLFHFRPVYQKKISKVLKVQFSRFRQAQNFKISPRITPANKELDREYIQVVRLHTKSSKSIYACRLCLENGGHTFWMDYKRKKPKFAWNHWGNGYYDVAFPLLYTNHPLGKRGPHSLNRLQAINSKISMKPQHV